MPSGTTNRTEPVTTHTKTDHSPPINAWLRQSNLYKSRQTYYTNGQYAQNQLQECEERIARWDTYTLQCLINQWASMAVTQAEFEDMSSPDGVFATVVGLKGAWGFGDTKEDAKDELESVLIDWVTVKLMDDDKDIPPMGGIHLVVKDDGH